MTKRQSLQLYGIATLFMLFHHLFLSIEMGYGNYCGTAYSAVGYNKIVMHLAWIFKICVAIFSFITGYGLFEKYSSRNITLIFSDNIKRSWRLYRKYWLVLMVFLPLCFGAGALNVNFSELVFNVVGLRSSYDAPAWYIRQYLLILIFSPLFIYLVNRLLPRMGKKPACIFLLVVPACFVIIGNVPQYTAVNKILHRRELIYLAIFFEGGGMREIEVTEMDHITRNDHEEDPVLDMHNHCFHVQSIIC